MIKILLADDHQIIREGLASLLQVESDMKIVAQANDGLDAVKLTQQLSPDVVVMDIAMPDLNGIEAAYQIADVCPNVKIIALSMHSDKRYIIEMLRAGAAGYLLKDCAFEELADAIRAVYNGETYLNPSMSAMLIESCVRNPVDEKSSVFTVLSTRERQVLQLLAESNTTKQVAKILHISPKTVETHRAKIMSKLNLDNIAALTKYAVREGLTTLDS